VLDALVRQARNAAVLVIATARPGTIPPWAGEDNVTRLALGRLSRLQTERLVARLGAKLPAAVVEQVLNRADGVPLFAEELTRAICDAAATDPAGGKPSPETLAMLVPATLQESLSARLDRLGAVKGTAQLAAVLGREFPLRWLEAVSPLPPEALRGELERLADSGLLQARGPEPGSAYVFKHALVQEAAYASLLKTTRQQYHEKVAQALEQQFPETAAQQPHLVAHHHAEAGQAAAAIEWWSKASARAAERFASREAVANLRRALELLLTFPEGAERDGRELALQMRLCGLLPSVSGYTSPETEAAYLRAQELCDRAGRGPETFFVRHGLWAFHLVCGRLEAAHQRARELDEIARVRGDTLSLLDAHYALGCTFADVGQPEAALGRLEQGMAVDAADPARPPSFHAGMELGITMPAFSTMPLWLLGRPDEALERATRTAQKARALGHPLSLAFALYYVTWAHLNRGEAVHAAERARELVKLSEEHGLFFAPLGSGMLGWALDQEASLVAAWQAPRRQVESSPASDADFERVASSLAFYRASGAILNVPFMQWLVALGHARRRRFAEARATLAEASEVAEATGESWWQSEVERLSGELALAAAATGGSVASARSEAEAAFRRAGELAAEQGALSLELRAALSLAELRRDEGRPEDARSTLAPVVARFVEGHATGDLVAARALLAELG
jgi:tetratricopeptide (TPR) repeat protein